jgi:hypothetical protein
VPLSETRAAAALCDGREGKVNRVERGKGLLAMLRSHEDASSAELKSLSPL